MPIRSDHRGGRIFGAVVAVLLAGAASADNLRFAGPMPVPHSSSVAMREVLVPRLAELSGGALTADTFPASQLGGPGENVDQVRTGVIFGSWVGMAYLSRTVPALEAVSLPFIYPDREAAFRVIDGEVSELLNAELAKSGFIALGYMELGSRNVTNNIRPITSIKDFEGLKIRLQPNETHLATFRALGANPVAMGADEVYSALQQGVVDGQENPFAIISTARYDEVQKHLSDTGHFFDFIILIANKAKYESLPEAERAALDAAVAETVAAQREMARAQSMEALEKLKGTMTFTPISPELRAELASATAGVVDDLKARIGAEIVDMVLAAAAK